MLFNSRKKHKHKKRYKKHRAKAPQFKLKPYAKQLVGYWSDSLLDAELIEPTGLDKGAKKQIPFRAILDGQCAKEIFIELHNTTEHHSRRGKKGEKVRFESDVKSDLKVLICPLRFFKSDRRMLGVACVEPFWIPAVLDSSGKLHPQAFRSPWIPRTLLDPLESDEYPAIGSVDALDSFPVLEKHSSWSEYWNYCDKLFTNITGHSVSAFRLDGYKKDATCTVFPDHSSAGSSTQLLKVYNQILKGQRFAGALLAFTEDKPPPRKPYSKSLSTISRSGFKHSGQFGNAYPLSRSQRLAVHHLLETPDGHALCITGPPGTGKTTCIQSIVASLWVQNARYKNGTPPIILVVGATNQSVMNVIESFAKAESDDDILAQRWLPGVKSYGTFCCSQHKSKSIEGYQLELRNGAGLSLSMEKLDYIQTAQSFFLRRFKQHSGKDLGLPRALEFLRQQLNAELSSMYREIVQLRDGNFIEWIRSVFGLIPNTTSEQLLEDLTKFDCTNRHRAFLIATHIWEARWLLSVTDELANRERLADTSPRFRAELSDWQRRALVTPAFVSTLQMAPRFFSRFNDDGQPLVDLIIFDEAGQVSPEYGAACAALAKRAVVVGDPLQLQPHRTIPKHVDSANAARSGLTKSADLGRWKALVAQGSLSSEGSMMMLSIHNSRYEEGSSRSVYLTEHRRSVPEIVAFCNQLAYNGRLIPKRDRLAVRNVPALGYAHIPGKSRKAGQSRYNHEEIESIARWLKRREPQIVSQCDNVSLAQAVAVITPFFAQARALEKKLLPIFPEMTIGTVNALQGAEREIVIFSTVYDRYNRGPYFFDRGVQMLNVAASRAKDSFLVFGDMAIFDPRNYSLPSSVLARHLFADSDNELLDIEPPPKADIPPEEISRLVTLDQHQLALRQAFELAKREVLIVSPTISKYALEADQIIPLIINARKRGVKVKIYTDTDLDSPNGQTKPNAIEGREMLIKSGAELKITARIHNKTLATDDRELIEGSFNWLSAVRTEGSRYQKYETSWRYCGPHTAKEIVKLRQEMEFRQL